MAPTIQAAPKVATPAPASAPAADAPAAPIADEKVAVRMCPTRADGAEPLFQHRLTVSQCASKQSAQYHKCFTCSHGCDRG
ncbi:MAG: hypothetical protein AAFU73_10165 [Planctomycetota bacterium]